VGITAKRFMNILRVSKFLHTQAFSC
jgi:hypothetical protein